MMFTRIDIFIEVPGLISPNHNRIPSAYLISLASIRDLLLNEIDFAIGTTAFEDNPFNHRRRNPMFHT